MKVATMLYYHPPFGWGGRGTFHFHIYYLVASHKAGSIGPNLQKKRRLGKARGALRDSLVSERAGLELWGPDSAPVLLGGAMLALWQVQSRLSASSSQRAAGHD